MKLSPEAEAHLNRYVSRMKDSLRGCRSVDVNDIEESIREHVAGAFGDSEVLVDSDHLEEVLEELGSPMQWVPDEEIPFWRKTWMRLCHGPEDFRLAYLSLLLFGISLLFFFVMQPVERLVTRHFSDQRVAARHIAEGMLQTTQFEVQNGEMRQKSVHVDTGPIPRGHASSAMSLGGCFVFLLLSFFLARSAGRLTIARDELGAQKWLLYPPLVSVYLFIVLAYFGIAAGIALGLDDYLRNPRAPMRPNPIATTVMLMGVFAIAGGAIMQFRPSMVQTLFWPFLKRTERWTRVLIYGGIFVIAVGGFLLRRLS